MAIKLPVKESIEIPEGKHTATITKVDLSERGTPSYRYVDVYLQLDKPDVEIRYGCPANLSANSKLGKLISVFTSLKAGKDMDIEKILVSKKISIMTVNEETERGTFARVIPESIKKA
jgi:hypothetical protein